MTQSKKYTELSVEALKAELDQLMKERFGLQMQRMTGQTIKLHLLREIRRNVARIKTMLATKGVKV